MERLKRPPIVEAWVSLEFEPREDAPPWGFSTAARFIAKYAQEFPRAEWVAKQQVQLQAGSPKDVPQVVSREVALETVRVFNEARTRWLQLRSDAIIYNVVEAGSAYPGFDRLREDGLAKFADYIEHFNPKSVQNATICYLDVVEIPAGADDIIQLEDYFTVVSPLPSEPFGNLMHFEFRHVFHCPVDDGPLVFVLQPVPSPREPHRVRFFMTWQKICTDVNTVDLATIRKRLDVSHEYLRQCFHAAVTPKTWQLFEPTPGE